MNRPAFKNSELGPIPADWEVKRFEEAFEFLRNNTLSRACMTEEGTVINIHYGDVLIRFGSILDCEKTMVPFVSPSWEKQVGKDLLKDGDLVVADTAEDDTVGKAVEMAGMGNRCAVAGLHTIACRPVREFAHGWLGHFINSSVFHNQLLPLIVGIKVSSISKNSLKSTLILCPPLSEQRRIAAALSDADAWIESLEKLIEKKKLVKQGAMQALLSGKTRLPGFSGEWEKRLLGEVAIFPTDTVPTDTTRLSDYVGTENMLPGGVGVVQYEDTLPYENIREYRIGDVLISNIRPYLKKTWLADRNGGCSTDVVVIRTRDKGVLTPEFLFAQLAGDSFFDFVMDNAIGTKMPRGDKRMMGLFAMPVPAFAEQRAITSVLSDMDAELAALTREKAKAEQIKQGMMQELLTGQVRLIGGE